MSYVIQPHLLVIMKEHSGHISPFHGIPPRLGILGTSQVGIYFHKDMQLNSKHWGQTGCG